VADLFEELSKRHPIPEELINGALELDKAYIPTRYPNAHPSGSPRTRYTQEEAARLIEHAGKIVKFCADLLSRI
jgi:HEPN domain-containing protein